MPKASYIETSVDGSNWYREKDVVPDEQISGIRAVDNKRLIFFFAAREAKFIRFIPESSNSCIMDNPSVDVYELR
jgi:hypothetical protein